jgi:type IV secretion system protein VirB10
MSALQPQFSPGGAGVKRVNNLPVVIAVVVFASFAAVIAYITSERSAKSAAILKETEQSKSAASELAYALTQGQPNGIIPAESSAQPPVTRPSEPDLIVPVAHVDLDYPPTPPGAAAIPRDEDAERIRQIKQQAFQEAIKAKSGGNVPSEFQTPKPVPVDPTSPQTAATPASQPAKDRWILNTRPESPATRYVIRTGSVIPGLMISAIESQLAGSIVAQISAPVYDTARGAYVLIPAGSKLYGIYSNEIAVGQERVLVAWQRIIFPDGSALDMGEMPGTGGNGVAGLAGDVDNHYARIFGHAVLMSLITGGATYSQLPQTTAGAIGGGIGYQQSASGTLSASLGQQLGQAGAAVLMKNLNIAPTIHVAAGFRLNVVVTKDLKFDRPYQPFAKSPRYTP